MSKISGTIKCKKCNTLYGYIINAKLIHAKILSFEVTCPYSGCGHKKILRTTKQKIGDKEK